VITVDDSVCESFLYSNFNFIFGLFDRAELSHKELNKLHELIHRGRDRSYTAGERVIYPDLNSASAKDDGVESQ
jgi:hypothetical protein